jgi:hypothetical protein
LGVDFEDAPAFVGCIGGADKGGGGKEMTELDLHSETYGSCCCDDWCSSDVNPVDYYV